MKIHDEIDDWSAGALCGALTPEERQKFERHLAECPRCRSLHEEDRKMNDTLTEAMAEARPDPNFERRIINGFREKIARGWFHPWRELHPWRGLVWLMRFRVAQAAAALVILAAMVEGGSMLTGEGFPGGATRADSSQRGTGANGADYSSVAGTYRPGTLALQDGSVNTLDLNDANGTHGLTKTGPGSLALTGAETYTGTTTIGAGATLQLGNGSSGNDGTIVNSAAGTTSVLDNGIAGITFSTDAAHAANNANWSTAANWGDTSWNSLGSKGQVVPLVPGAGGLSGSLSAGDTAAFGSTGSITMEGSGMQTLSGTGLITGAVNNGALVYDRFGHATYGGTIQNENGSPALGIVKEGTGIEVFAGTNTYTGATTINGGTLHVTNSYGLGYGGRTYGVTVTDGNAVPSSSTASGTLDVSGNNVTIGSLSSNSTLSGTGTVTLSSTGSDNQYTRMTVAGSGYTSGSPGADLIWSGNDAFTGSVNIASGTVTQVKPIWQKGQPVKVKYRLAQNTTAQNPARLRAPAPAATPPPIDTRKLIRNATLDFEVASFEKALDTIGSVAGEEQGFIFSQSSAKGANGKLQGQVIVKVLPANLDRFLLKLRLLGDMKNQTVSAQDVSKDYYDTEARIRNSEVTEARLIEMMKTRTGKVSELLEVENEIAKVRGEIEQMQGQLKFYDALVQYATVTISLEEKDLNQAAAYLLTEQAQLYLFSKDVEKAFADAKTDAAGAKAQTLESHIERDEAGHVIATLHLLIPPENADETIVKLKEIGRIQHFNSQTQRVAKDDGNDAAPSDTAKVDRDKVELTMTIQQDSENPVQGTNISIQTDQVEEKTKRIKDEAADAGVEVKGAEFNRLRNGAEISAMLLRMPIHKYNEFLEKIKALGNVKDFTVARREDSTATDDAPAEIVLQIYSQAGIVAPDTGLWFTVRHTLGQGMAALMWSVRMIGVSLAFIAPWAVILAVVAWVAVRRRWLARK